ncbi:MAG: type 4a pilus biogenesis protein PilO [bacterium]|nr:type 4a pilus biogenesis protein PilO [bacterium]
MTRTVFAAILILAALGIWVYWARPIFDEAKTLSVQKGELENVLLQFQKLRKVRDDLMTKYNSIPQDELVKLNAMLPSEPDSGGLLVTLENLSRSSGVLLKKVDIKEKKEGIIALGKTPEVFERLPFEISVVSSYEAFRALLAALEQNLRLSDINEISFTTSEKNTYEFLIKADTYWQAR